MIGEIAEYLSEIGAAPTADSFVVRQLSDQTSYYVGRDGLGRAALLIQSGGSGRSIPIQLAGIEARFAVPCSVSANGSPEDTRILSAIICLSSDSSIESYFATISESIVSLLGPRPTTDDVGNAVDHLVELFQKLQKPARRSVTGIIGELCVLLFAANAAAAIDCWRVDPEERFDFVAGNLRLDVKASSLRRRSHEVSFDQANPPKDTRALFASIWIEAAGGDLSLSGLLAQIEQRLGEDARLIAKLRNVVADTLGATLPAAMSFRFDARLARSSLRLYDASAVPAIRPPLAPGITGLKFASDFDLCGAVDFSALGEKLKIV